MSEDDATKKMLYPGTLIFQRWYSGATSDEVGELVTTLNLITGVVRATRSSSPDGLSVVAVISLEYDVKTVIKQINRECEIWANRHGVTIVDGDNKPMNP